MPTMTTNEWNKCDEESLCSAFDTNGRVRRDLWIYLGNRYLEEHG